jgi:tRNA/rRNA methyltransferase
MKISPVIILVRPQLGENIGAAARAMLNFGLRDLRIVEPRDGWPSLKAERASAGALEGDQMEVRAFDSVPDALADLHLTFATTARSRDINKSVFSPPEAVSLIQENPSLKAGLVFGPERTGLTNEDLQYCQHILTFPVNPEFSSLNIAQAVLLMSYALCQPVEREAIPPKHPSDLPAAQNKLEDFFLRLESTLEIKGFYKAPHLKESIQRNVRTMLMRADFSEQELGTLQGILSALASNKN